MKSETIDNKIPTLQKSHHIALHPSQPIAYITNIESGSISVINYATSQIMETISCGKGTQSLDITADGSEIWVTNSNENTIGIIDPKKQTNPENKTGNEPMGLKFSVDGRYCLVTNLKMDISLF
jgi:YVTN family beta-propeller protein